MYKGNQNWFRYSMQARIKSFSYFTDHNLEKTKQLVVRLLRLYLECVKNGGDPVTQVHWRFQPFHRTWSNPRKTSSVSNTCVEVILANLRSTLLLFSFLSTFLLIYIHHALRSSTKGLNWSIKWVTCFHLNLSDNFLDSLCGSLQVQVQRLL